MNVGPSGGSRGDEAEKRIPNGGDSLLTSAATDPSSDDDPGLPRFRTWRGVYLFVAGCFVAYVVLLTLFTRVFAR